MQFGGKSLLIRADANACMGTGHLMRCLALAQAWQDAGGQATFLMAMEASALEERLRSEKAQVIHLSTQPGSTDDAIRTADLAHQMNATWVMLDGYHFGADYQRIIKDAEEHLLVVDDNGQADHYYADLVLNQNIHAHEDFYANRSPYTRLLLGTRYVLLRREFLRWKGWKRDIPETACKVLVTLGGGDPDNVTLKALQALRQVEMDGLEAVVVVGGSNPHYEELQSVIYGSQLAIRLESNVTDMPALMVWADVAVSAGGSTSWELAFMGLPNLVLVLAENQWAIAQGLARAGVSRNLGWWEDVSENELARHLETLLAEPGLRDSMSQRGHRLVDGLGATRLLDVLGGHPDDENQDR